MSMKHPTNITVTREAHRALVLYKYMNEHATISDAILAATRSEEAARG